jgi:protein-S-isoprenylcysteine O-methyltransferase Ste14
MPSLLFALGVTVAATLLALLLATLVHRPLRIWPTPGVGTWQSYMFWPLFRGLNVLCFATALTDSTNTLGLPGWLRVVALACLAASVALFVYAFRVLGRDNSYGAQDGLVTSGIYQWSRNPQNAMLMVVYGCLAVAADTSRTYWLCGAMIATYALMVFAEEPWLRKGYGEAYQRYCRDVPRFFNWRRAGLWVRGQLKTAAPPSN